MNTFKVLTINRHRFTIDGKGITTLVGLAGCPLNCLYCINKKTLSQGKIRECTAEQLLQVVMIDYCYFLATNGGITFGGGEPLLHSEAILKLFDILPQGIAINIETSLNHDDKCIPDVLNKVTELIIDIKSMNKEIYKQYTEKDNILILKWLNYIKDNNLQDKCTIRIPNIPNYTTKEDIEYSINIIKQMGFKNIDTFNYTIRKDEE